jgi:hypothetical protein
MDGGWKIAVPVIALAMVLFGVLVFASNKPAQVPAVTMGFVSNTEYNIGEAGQIIVEARFQNGTSAISSCQLLSWYPDKSLFLNVSGLLSVSGNEYVNFTVPNTTGVYEYQAQCVLLNGKNGTISKSFHVSEFQNETSARLGRIRAVMPK